METPMIERFLPFRVTACGIPELATHVGAGVTHVLSILDPEEPEPPAFADFPTHHRLELRFHDIVEDMPGQQLPEPGDVDRILAFGRDVIAAGPRAGHLLVHCHMGISRSTAALTMMLVQAAPARSAAEAVAAVVGIRALAWPNLRLIEFADTALGRDGELVTAVRRRHRAYAADHPEIVTFMRNNGRAREVTWPPE
jgi:predicted protein tyrosine phosphatase